MTGRDDSSEPSREELNSLRFRANRLYLHKVMRVNYTSYDIRRQQDSVNPRTHPDVMMLNSPDADHPYLYARVLSIFHVNAYCVNAPEEEPHLVQVLWIRWLDYDASAPGGFVVRRPHRLKFAHVSNEPFAFIDPDKIVRGVHLIPVFHHQRADNGLAGYTIARSDRRQDDWKYLYIGMYVAHPLCFLFLGPCLTN